MYSILLYIIPYAHIIRRRDNFLKENAIFLTSHQSNAWPDGPAKKKKNPLVLRPAFFPALAGARRGGDGRREEVVHKIFRRIIFIFCPLDSAGVLSSKTLIAKVRWLQRHRARDNGQRSLITRGWTRMSRHTEIIEIPTFYRGRTASNNVWRRRTEREQSHIWTSTKWLCSGIFGRNYSTFTAVINARDRGCRRSCNYNIYTTAVGKKRTIISVTAFACGRSFKSAWSIIGTSFVRGVISMFPVIRVF